MLPTEARKRGGSVWTIDDEERGLAARTRGTLGVEDRGLELVDVSF